MTQLVYKNILLNLDFENLACKFNLINKSLLELNFIVIQRVKLFATNYINPLIANDY